jgi:ribosomal protein S18 acetylase RimI-like enzyme
VPGGIVSATAIRDVQAGEVRLARALFEEYAASIGVDLCFQGFAQELESLPGAYAPPHGCLLLAWQDEPVGCVALRPLDGSSEAPRIGEVKRLYVRPSARGSGVGRALAMAVVERARACGYRELKLDTLATMMQARALYASLGFRTCAPYYDNPLPGVTYMSLDLKSEP